MLNSQTITLEQLAKTIDHSLLKPEMTVPEVLAGCELAAEYRTASVCAKPCDVLRCVKALNGTGVAVGTVVAFPHGSSSTESKLFEAELALADGATELDMVMNIGHMRSGLFDEVQQDIAAIVRAGNGKALVKVIFENAYLTKDDIVKACRIAEAAGADFVKTSTGYAPTGATVEDVRLMRASVGVRGQVKAAHGVRTLDALLEMIDAGATRVGATTTKTMLDEFASRPKSSEQTAAPTY
jgi:deoxyribose-phosphate aldolase